MNPAAKVGESEKQATEEPSNELIEEALVNQRNIFADNSLKQLETSLGQMIQWLERMLVYVDGVLAKPEPGDEDSEFGRKLMNVAIAADKQFQPEKMDALVESSIQEFTMISYLSMLTKSLSC